MSTIADALTAIRAALADVDELTHAPIDPPEQLTSDTLPATVVYPGPTQWEFVSHDGDCWVAMTVMIGVYLPRTTLPRNVREVIAIKQSVPMALFTAFTDHQFNGTVNRLGQAEHLSTTPPIRDDFGEDDWGEDLIRLPFQLDVVLYVEGA